MVVRCNEQEVSTILRSRWGACLRNLTSILYLTTGVNCVAVRCTSKLKVDKNLHERNSLESSSDLGGLLQKKPRAVLAPLPRPDSPAHWHSLSSQVHIHHPFCSCAILHQFVYTDWHIGVKKKHSRFQGDGRQRMDLTTATAGSFVTNNNQPPIPLIGRTQIMVALVVREDIFHCHWLLFRNL